MSRLSQSLSRRRRRGHVGAVVVLAVASMWIAGAAQFTGGILDLVVFAPPGAALGLATVWSAHVFTPSAFSWRRAVGGAVVGGVIVGPLVAALVAFSAAWDPASFQLVFGVGAWLAFAAGFATGGTYWVSTWLRTRWRLRRRRLRKVRCPRRYARAPDASDGIRPTPPPDGRAYPVPQVHSS
jgi:hypothetical protein